MMQSLRGAWMAIGAAIAAAGFAGSALAGCGDDTSATATDGGGGDVTGDVMEEVTTDTQTDTAEASPTESGTDAGPDVGPDVVMNESGPDAPLDSGDASDAPNYGPLELAFAQNLAQAYCQNQLSCCPGGVSQYNLQACEAYIAGYGWEANLPSNYGIFNGGFVALDSTKAANCVAAIQALPCAPQTPAQWGAVTSACDLVLYGTLMPNEAPGCVSSFECAPGNYCSAATDGGRGACVPLHTAGQSCDVGADGGLLNTENTVPDYMCSYLGTSNTGLYCDLIDPVGSANYATCQPLINTTQGNCYNATTSYYDDQACGQPSGGPLCGDNGCGTNANYPYAPFCTEFLLDAGGGG